MDKPMRSWIHRGEWTGDYQVSDLREASETEVAHFILSGDEPLKVEACTGTETGNAKCQIVHCQAGVGFRILYAEDV